MPPVVRCNIHTPPERSERSPAHRGIPPTIPQAVWERMFQHLCADADNEYAMIDSTIVRAHQHSAGAQKKLGRIRPSAAPAAA